MDASTGFNMITKTTYDRI
ncbi:Protein of unknown function [Lactobacillus delbrueckii subsp. lactis]|nr:Protein of unknown function [Lactobacillus delbrueckii subsp. lactis]